MLNAAINRFNRIRKTKHQNNRLFLTRKKYAFIGIGMHSLANFYPLLHHFSINLKYIYTKSSQSGVQLKKQFPSCTFTHNLSDILNDTEVEGVFVCSTPSSHFSILHALADAGKKIFIEKPPCESLHELEILISNKSLEICKVGFQRRYWPGNKIVAKKIKKAKSYCYNFLFGSYISGNPYTELFIHALDYCLFLFGECKILSSNVVKDSSGETLHLHVKHNEGISGLIEASTHFSWNSPQDRLTINCTEETIEVTYPKSVRGFQKPTRVLNIPTERFLQQPEITKDYFNTGNNVLPIRDLNTLVVQGFYNEVEVFIALVENADRHVIKNDLPGLLPLYRMLHQISVR